MAECPYHFTISGHFQPKATNSFFKRRSLFWCNQEEKKTPFIVRTDKYDIEVLGTQFDVDAYPDQTAFETTLMKGSVKVTSQHFPEQTITLKPHHKAYVKDGQLAVTKVNDFTPYRWKEGLICFKDEPFQTIMEDFEKYYGIRIIINNKKVLKYSYNGKFRQADGIDYALRVLQRDIHFKYERANDEEIIYINWPDNTNLKTTSLWRKAQVNLKKKNADKCCRTYRHRLKTIFQVKKSI